MKRLGSDQSYMLLALYRGRTSPFGRRYAQAQRVGDSLVKRGLLKDNGDKPWELTEEGHAIAKAKDDEINAKHAEREKKRQAKVAQDRARWEESERKRTEVLDQFLTRDDLPRTLTKVDSLGVAVPGTGVNFHPVEDGTWFLRCEDGAEVSEEQVAAIMRILNKERE